jgi:dsDNA-specific endonuclease/ATPase MutS2
MSNLKIGDRVEAIDDIIQGIVVQVGPGGILVETSDGFQMEFSINELVKVSERDSIRVSAFDAAQVKVEKETPGKKKQAPGRSKEKEAPKLEVDLHINQLVTSTRNMSNYEILNIQMETAKRQLEFALSKRIRKVVFIHGVGEGVLKEELFSLFRRYEHVRYYDADYQKYGLGATEIYIYQNP